MSYIEEVWTKDAPALEEFPFSQAIKHGDTVYVSGSVAINPDSGKMIDGGVSEQTKQVFENISAILKAADTSIDNIVKVTVFLEDIDEFETMNEVYRTYVSKPFPTRSAFEVGALAADFEVEIEVTAAVLPKGDGSRNEK